jgi:hypothetical protein
MYRNTEKKSQVLLPRGGGAYRRIKNYKLNYSFYLILMIKNAIMILLDPRINYQSLEIS